MLVPLLPGEAFSTFQQRIAKLVARPEEQPGDIQVSFVFYGRVMPLSCEGVLADRSDVQAQWNDCTTTGVMVHIGVNHTPPVRRHVPKNCQSCWRKDGHPHQKVIRKQYWTNKQTIIEMLQQSQLW